MASFGRLKVISGLSAGTVWDLDREGAFPIGRSPKARYRLDDEAVDFVHAGIHCGPGSVAVDSRSAAVPVKVNGEVLAKRTVLSPGDLLLVGGVTLEFLAPEGPPPGPATPPPPAREEAFRPVAWSGRAPLPGVLAGLCAGLCAGIPLAFLYAYIDLYNPCINVITILFTAGFGFLTGVAAGFGMTRGKVRCRSTYRIVGGVVGLVALHVSWVVWTSAFLGSQHRLRSQHPTTVSYFLLHPGELISEVGRINDVGAWGLFGSWTPTGFALGLVWLVEAAMIVAGAIIGAMVSMPPLFCEECESWGETRAGVLKLKTLEKGEVESSLAAGDLSFLAATPPAAEDARAWTQVDLAACTGCGNTRTLTVQSAAKTFGEKGKPEVKLHPVRENLLLSREEAEWVEGLPGAAPHPEPEAVEARPPLRRRKPR